MVFSTKMKYVLSSIAQRIRRCFVFTGLLLGPLSVFAQETEELIKVASVETVNSGDTAWMLTSSALVMMMTLPGLALFYGGLVRSKNVLSVLMQCLISAGLIGVLWVVVGYSWAFGGEGKFFGNFQHFLLAGINPDSVSGSIPTYVFVMFQGMFAIITPALMLGAFAERMRFGPYMVFIAIWLLVVYCPLAHMVWGGGMISQWGAIDFAGGLVVHMSSGFSALAAAYFLGKRKGFGHEHIMPHNLPLTIIGAALLWVGWFGFNAGSELAADGTGSCYCGRGWSRRHHPCLRKCGPRGLDSCRRRRWDSLLLGSHVIKAGNWL